MFWMVTGVAIVAASGGLLALLVRRGGERRGDAESAGQALDQLDATFGGDPHGHWDGIDRLKTPPPGIVQG